MHKCLSKSILLTNVWLSEPLLTKNRFSTHKFKKGSKNKKGKLLSRKRLWWKTKLKKQKRWKNLKNNWIKPKLKSRQSRKSNLKPKNSKRIWTRRKVSSMLTKRWWIIIGLRRRPQLWSVLKNYRIWMLPRIWCASKI